MTHSAITAKSNEITERIIVLSRTCHRTHVSSVISTKRLKMLTMLDEFKALNINQYKYFKSLVTDNQRIDFRPNTLICNYFQRRNLFISNLSITAKKTIWKEHDMVDMFAYYGKYKTLMNSKEKSLTALAALEKFDDLMYQIDDTFIMDQICTETQCNIVSGSKRPVSVYHKKQICKSIIPLILIESNAIHTHYKYNHILFSTFIAIYIWLIIYSTNPFPYEPCSCHSFDILFCKTNLVFIMTFQSKKIYEYLQKISISQLNKIILACFKRIKLKLQSVVVAQNPMAKLFEHKTIIMNDGDKLLEKIKTQVIAMKCWNISDIQNTARNWMIDVFKKRLLIQRGPCQRAWGSTNSCEDSQNLETLLAEAACDFSEELWYKEPTDFQQRKPNELNYNPVQFYVPQNAFKQMTPIISFWWKQKSTHFDKLILLKIGMFYRLCYKDADIAREIFGLRYQYEKSAPFVGFPVSMFNKYNREFLKHGYNTYVTKYAPPPISSESTTSQPTCTNTNNNTLIKNNSLNFIEIINKLKEKTDLSDSLSKLVTEFKENVNDIDISQIEELLKHNILQKSESVMPDLFSCITSLLGGNQIDIKKRGKETYFRRKYMEQPELITKCTLLYMIGRIISKVDHDYDKSILYFSICSFCNNDLYQRVLSLKNLSLNCYWKGNYLLGIKVLKSAYKLSNGCILPSFVKHGYLKQKRKFKRKMKKMKCANCNESCRKLRLCSGCMQIEYCSRLCQKLDWKQYHKYICSASQSWRLVCSSLKKAIFDQL
eukprot:14150_1